MKLLIYVFLITTCLAGNAQTKKKAWFDAEIVLVNGTELIGTASYNLRDFIVVLKKKNEQVEINADSIQHMVLTRESFEHIFQRIHLDGKSVLFELVYKGSNSYDIYQQHFSRTERNVNNGHIIYTQPIKANKNKDSFVSIENGFSRRGSTLWMINEAGEHKLINRKNVLSSFNDKRKELKTYIDNFRLSFQIKDDIVKLFKYYDSIKN